MTSISFLFITLALIFIPFYSCVRQIGPDPWDYEIQNTPDDTDVPPDLRLTSNKKKVSLDNSLGISDIFFRRILAIIMKGSQTQKHEDGSVEVVLQMRFDPERWDILDKYIKSDSVITESVVRRSMGYIEEAIYKPTILEKVIMAWSDYIKFYFIEYKLHIMWTFGLSAVILGLIWLCKHLSPRRALLIIFIMVYLYEVYTSYKEAEQQEVDKFLSALNKCQWQFWKSNCEVPPPDILLFLKHMNPLKIAMRMFTSIVSEPLITLSSTLKTMISGITDGLWPPFGEILAGILILSFDALLIVLLVLIVFNYLLNIPFNLSFLGLNIGVQQRNRAAFSETINPPPSRHPIENTERIVAATLNQLLSVLPHANNNTQKHPEPSINTMRRSASTGRLPISSSERNLFSLENTRRRQNAGIINGPRNGGGDT